MALTASNSSTGPSPLQQLVSEAPIVLPSMLLCDFGNLQHEVESLESAGTRGFHLDVMDGQFVPNLTYGLPIVEAFRRLTELPLDVHLMIDHPQKYAVRFIEAGADVLTFHVEAAGLDTTAARQLLDNVRSRVPAGIAINPATTVESIEPLLPHCDLVCVMSVEAGFGGQSFQPQVLEKLKQIRQLAGPELVLEIDGGVNADTIGNCVSAGAQLLVAGSAILKQDDYRDAFAQLKMRMGNK